MRASHPWKSALPKTDYTYSSLSRHRQEISPGVMALPNMSRRRVDALRERSFSSASTSSYDTVDHNQFLLISYRNSEVQTSVLSRIWNFICLCISNSISTVTNYWSERNTRIIYELRTPPQRSIRRESFIHRFSSSLSNLINVIYRCILHVMLLDTWLLSRLRSDGRPSGVISFWPFLIVLFLFAGWSLSELQLMPSFLSAAMSSSISGVKALSESTLSVLTTLPFDSVQRFAVGVLLAPWNILVALSTGLCYLGSLILSSLSLLTFTSFQDPSVSTSAPVPPVFVNVEKSGVSQDYLQELSASLASLQDQLSRLRQDVEDLKTSQKSSENRDLENLRNLVIEKEASLLQVIAGAQHQLQGGIDDVNERVKLKADESTVERKLERIRVEQGVLFEGLNEVKSGLKVSLDRSNLYWKLAGDGRDTLRKLMVLQMQLDGLRKQVNKCCDQLTSAQRKEDIRVEIMHVLHTLTPAAYDDAHLRRWVRSVFIAQDDLNAALANVTANFNEELKRRESIFMENSAAEISARISKYEYEHRASSDSTWRNNGSMDEWQVRRIVENVLAVYDADKTGMSDFALESQGGEVISTRCTETYQRTSPSLSLLGIPLWHPSNSPRTVIQPGMHPGDCWAFAGSQGYLVVRLSHVIHVKGFSYEHVPAALLPTGQIDSAPKNFSVWGLREEIDKEPIFLGSYQYTENGTSLQYFAVETPDVPPLQLIELHITSNHGNINYTCLYRFRVHGKIA